ncbi:MAG: hypothetical protein M1837_004695 [Sclerophora amabilis]|nr:MAG: hypothetical protein M1837_004695 [Sclerophora amabilis]
MATSTFAVARSRIAKPRPSSSSKLFPRKQETIKRKSRGTPTSRGRTLAGAPVTEEDDDDEEVMGGDEHVKVAPRAGKRSKTTNLTSAHGADRARANGLAGSHELDLAGEVDPASSEKGGKKKETKKANPSSRKTSGTEKRLKRFRSHAPQSYLERLERVLTQRMFLLDRDMGDGSGAGPEGSFDLAGTTGNVYTVKIRNLPSCTCPDNQVKGNQCKHIIYVLVNVLKAPEDLRYQAAFLTSELEHIFAQAPPPPDEASSLADSHSGQRKPIEGDCPICILELEPEQDEVIWCKGSCGNNIHKQCFEQWAASKPGEEVRCVFCRAPWKGDEESVKKIYRSREKNQEGYVNMASELGLSGHRDYSSYHQRWVKGRFG